MKPLLAICAVIVVVPYVAVRAACDAGRQVWRELTR